MIQSQVDDHFDPLTSASHDHPAYDTVNTQRLPSVVQEGEHPLKVLQVQESVKIKQAGNAIVLTLGRYSR